MIGADDPKLTSTLLYLDGVAVSFDGYKALRGLSLILEPGEMRAIIGPNGAGKTTMMDVITGKTRPDDGRRLFRRTAQSSPARRGRNRRARRRPQIPEADRVRKSHGRRQHSARRQGAAQPCSQRCSAARQARERETIDRILATTRLTEHARIVSAAIFRTARSNGSRSACCWRRTQSCCWSTSRSPA